ncbi:ketoacyl-ACP synthase III [Candidatus Sumerlaeota bacterium]|nr:ketoacyl-ACP synthase III [Candidatus Sumerlaeota bacterium]
MAIGILGIGSAYPDRILTNHDLEKMVDTSDEWIRTRSGISERRICDADTATSHMACDAGRKAIEDAGLKPEDIDLIVVATFSPDTLIPSTACWVMAKLNIPNCAAFDINAACTGWIYGVSTALGLMQNGLARHALVIGADAITKFVDFQDRATCVLFGDGAGAAVLGEVEQGRGFLSETLGADGRMGPNLMIPGGGSARPISQEVLDNREAYVKMQGNEVFKFAVRIMCDSLCGALSKAGLAPADLDWVIPHQANIRIIEGAIKRLDIPRERFIVNIERFGNTSAASIGIAMDEAVRDGRIKRGDLVGLVAFGGGLTWGAAVVRY